MRFEGTLISVVRFPVKSMAGESLQEGVLTRTGLQNDRLYAFESTNAPSGMLRLSGKERRAMLGYRARLTGGQVAVETPTGEIYPVDSGLLIEYFKAHISNTAHFSLVESSVPQTDVRPLSLISRQTVSQIASEVGRPIRERRFRANLIVDLADGPFGEDGFVGTRLRVGPSAVLEIIERVPRCRVVTHDPDAPKVEEPAFEIMRALDRFHQGRAGVYARIVTPGAVRSNDAIQVVDQGFSG
jgi:uncharacterized protein YcbX